MIEAPQAIGIVVPGIPGTKEEDYQVLFSMLQMRRQMPYIKMGFHDPKWQKGEEDFSEKVEGLRGKINSARQQEIPVVVFGISAGGSVNVIHSGSGIASHSGNYRRTTSY